MTEKEYIMKVLETIQDNLEDTIHALPKNTETENSPKPNEKNSKEDF